MSDQPRCRKCGEEVSYGALHVCRPVCVWEKFTSQKVNVFPYWTASCRPRMQFDKAPSDGGWKYCPFCGGIIEVTA